MPDNYKFSKKTLNKIKLAREKSFLERLTSMFSGSTNKPKLRGEYDGPVHRGLNSKGEYDSDGLAKAFSEKSAISAGLQTVGHNTRSPGFGSLVNKYVQRIGHLVDNAPNHPLVKTYIDTAKKITAPSVVEGDNYEGSPSSHMTVSPKDDPSGEHLTHAVLPLIRQILPHNKDELKEVMANLAKRREEMKPIPSPVSTPNTKRSLPINTDFSLPTIPKAMEAALPLPTLRGEKGVKGKRHQYIAEQLGKGLSHPEVVKSLQQNFMLTPKQAAATFAQYRLKNAIRKLRRLKESEGVVKYNRELTKLKTTNPKAFRHIITNVLDAHEKHLKDNLRSTESTHSLDKHLLKAIQAGHLSQEEARPLVGQHVTLGKLKAGQTEPYTMITKDLHFPHIHPEASKALTDTILREHAKNLAHKLQDKPDAVAHIQLDTILDHLTKLRIPGTKEQAFKDLYGTKATLKPHPNGPGYYQLHHPSQQIPVAAKNELPAPTTPTLVPPSAANPQVSANPPSITAKPSPTPVKQAIGIAKPKLPIAKPVVQVDPLSEHSIEAGKYEGNHAKEINSSIGKIPNSLWQSVLSHPKTVIPQDQEHVDVPVNKHIKALLHAEFDSKDYDHLRDTTMRISKDENGNLKPTHLFPKGFNPNAPAPKAVEPEGHDPDPRHAYHVINTAVKYMPKKFMPEISTTDKLGNTLNKYLNPEAYKQSALREAGFPVIHSVYDGHRWVYAPMHGNLDKAIQELEDQHHLVIGHRKMTKDEAKKINNSAHAHDLNAFLPEFYPPLDKYVKLAKKHKILEEHESSHPEYASERKRKPPIKNSRISNILIDKIKETDDPIKKLTQMEVLADILLQKKVK